MLKTYQLEMRFHLSVVALSHIDLQLLHQIDSSSDEFKFAIGGIRNETERNLKLSG